jgi:predicted ATPase
MSGSEDEAPDLVPVTDENPDGAHGDALRTGAADVPAEAEAVKGSAQRGRRRQFEMSVPVTLITGYLGAGKTTLVERILTAKHGFKIAVILNEIGDEKGIEKALVQDEAGAQPSLACARAWHHGAR